MTETERPDFRAILTALASTFCREVDAAAMTGYWIGLEDLELYAVQRACRRAIRECERMPTVKNIRDFASLYHRPEKPPMIEEGGEESIGLRERLKEAMSKLNNGETTP